MTSVCAPTLGLGLGKDCGLLAADTMAISALSCDAVSSESDISRAWEEMLTSLSGTVTISGWLEVTLWPSANHDRKDRVNLHSIIMSIKNTKFYCTV